MKLVYPPKLPTDRFARFLEDYMRRKGEITVRELSYETGLGERRLYAILNREFSMIQWDTVDRVLCHMGLVHMWHEPPEKGGLLDVRDTKPALPPGKESRAGT